MIYVRFHLYIQRTSRSMIKQQNSGATAHVVLYTPRQSTVPLHDLVNTYKSYHLKVYVVGVMHSLS